MSARSYLGTLPDADLERLARLKARLKAQSNVETIRRISITMEALLDHQENDGSIVLCKQGLPDKVVWFV